MENIKKFGAVTHKANSFAFEPRDTANPALITGLLITILEGIGHLVRAEPISKRVKDEVRFKDSLIPWRRSPFWLLLRVGVLRHLHESTDSTVANVLYKALMCILQSQLLSQVVGSQRPEVSHLLLRKLCRRIAKVEKDRTCAARINSTAAKVHDVVLDSVRPLLLQATTSASETLQMAWDNYKSRVQRRVTSFRTRWARPEHLRLGLRNSTPYFDRLRQQPILKVVPSRRFVMEPGLLQFLKSYSDLAETEDEILKQDASLTSVDQEPWFTSVLALAKEIDSYLSKCSDQCYEVGTVDRSRMVLVAMWLWMSMDQLLCRFVPEFSRYRPVFHPHIVDCLLLATYADLRRLHEIQIYLMQRHKDAGSIGPCQTIFSAPIANCFAHRYFESLESDSPLHLLSENIVEAEEERKAAKELEWGEKDAEHQLVTKELAAITCQFTFVGELLVPAHDERKCRKCILTKKADKLAIERIEKATPYNTGEAKAVLLELRCPKAYSAYRNATWAIAAVLGLPDVEQTKKEPLTMSENYYAEFSRARAPCKTGVTLASRTKSFLQTHFRYIHFPIPFDKVCVNNGLRFEYYDCGRKLWPAEHLHRISFDHHCWLPIPRRSPFAQITFPSRSLPGRPQHGDSSDSAVMSSRFAQARYLKADAELSSNEVLAGLPLCPQTLGTPEFMSFQSLLAESQRLWPAILVELGSSNLNFSSEAITVFLEALTNRTGPPREDKFHATNLAFRDDSFCNSLLNQIERRLSSIGTNWREHYAMEVLLGLVLKIHTLGSDIHCTKATQMLETIRKLTLNWLKAIRKELWTSISTAASAGLTSCILWAALLCKRTFTTYCTREQRNLEDLSTLPSEEELETPCRTLASSALVMYLEASITLQENLVEQLGKLSPLLRSALIRDLKMATRLTGRLRVSLEKSPRALVAAAAKADATTFLALSIRPISVSFDERADGVWVKISLPGKSKSNFGGLCIRYHLVSGVLLLNGRPIEKELPPNVRRADAIARLFQNQRLAVYASTVPGMTYKIAFNPENQEVHLGFRQGDLVVQAWAQSGLWEYIPANIFERDATFDLPASLIDDCVHWLNIDANIIEVRKFGKIWRSAPGNWNINLSTQAANRRNSLLLDPGSNLFNHVASVFRGFEDSRHITVYQSQNFPLAVELRRYELTFFVNARRLLECQQLRAEIDENQDAGCFYGLSSSLVLRDVQNPSDRSIIVPLGPVTVRRKGMHVDVEVKNTENVVGRFFLDDVLGRVTCGSEPRLFYTKALLHACTSFCLPDPLTAKTGAEEACHILQAGGSQPYAPLTDVNQFLLSSIADLSPKRQFYPEDLRVMETVSWAGELGVCIQDDRYLDLVNVIKHKSALLAPFEQSEDASTMKFVPSESHAREGTNAHLMLRSQKRRLAYQRPDIIARGVAPTEDHGDLPYLVRGHHDYQKSQEHVFEAARLINDWPNKLPSTALLHVLMQQWPHIAGYGDGMIVYDKVRLSDHLDVDVASSWGPLVNFCRLTRQDAKYRLLFLLATICFREELDVRAMHTLVAFAAFEDLKKIDLPSWPSYTQFRPGFCPKPEYLRRLLDSCATRLETSESQAGLTQRERRAVDAARRAHEQQNLRDLDSLVNFMCAQWPCARPDLEPFLTNTLDLESALSLVALEWHAMFQNHEFEEHLRQVQDVLDRNRTARPIRAPRKPALVPCVLHPRGFPLVQFDLLKKEGPFTKLRRNAPLSALPPASTSLYHAKYDINELRSIVAELPKSKSIVRQEYLQGLLYSINALESYRKQPGSPQQSVDVAQLDFLVNKARNTVSGHVGGLIEVLKKDEPGAPWLTTAGIWPMASRVSLLEALRSTNVTPLTRSMRSAIIRLGLAITQLQRLLRIQDASRRGKTQQLEDEVKNSGHTNWEPELYADWLLVEVDANILIRPIQAEVAFQTITPASGSNSVLQLNMGQGKTSIIIPLVASVLADGKSLCRVVVPKALLLQTAQLLQSRLGGLLGRELRHIPFSRRTPSTYTHIQAYGEIHESILKDSGIIIALPEHSMSFILSSQQRLLDGKLDEGTKMAKVQRWLSKMSRDVFDESDFTMAVKTQLIYPSGPQVTVDGGKHRWETIQMVLRLVFSHLYVLEQSFQSSIQVVRRQGGGFPFIYFLRNDVQHALMQRLVMDICTGRTDLLNMEKFSGPDRHAIKAFITEATPEKAVVKQISDIHKNSPPDGYVIYLLRGLLVHRLLILTLSRRWNVQYGIHPTRDPVSVPFLFKGIASNLAEWGHVDVSLLFTCLSFYYQGLSMMQLRQSLEQILKSDDPAREYEHWTEGSVELPDRHRDWTSINLEDVSQLTEIWKAVRYNMSAIDHFLNNFVFPRHAKQFKIKIQATGWDLPLSGSGTSLTTGFSGTNDNRLVLPLTIKQDDLKGLAHTNAEVLSYLLHPRSRAYSLAGFREVLNGRAIYRRMSEPELLRKLCIKRIRILIDAGALILEMTNVELVRIWLDIDHEAAAAIYFDEDKAMMLTRAGRKTPLLASPYADDLTSCLVYLDESHTRGTDMKFPPDARGAVTLSLGQTKDHTVQAVMRLRQLATSQSITYFAPPEVHQSILDYRCKGDKSHLDSHDVVCWLLEQTCHGLENLQPLYYAQGLNYCHRIQAAYDHPQYLSNPIERTAYLGALQDHEQQSLKSLYEPRTERKRKCIQDEKHDWRLAKHIRELERRRKAFQDTGTAVHASALQEVEQEREVAVEAETIRERQKPVFFHPHTFSGLASELRDFVLSGALSLDDMIWETAFSYMKRTATGLKYPAALPASRLLVSAEFRQAVIVPSGKVDDDFLRPVQWILWSGTTETAVLVSPEEAEQLIPLCRGAPKQVVHILTYAAPVTQKMLQFNDLNYYAVPELPTEWKAPMWVKLEVGIFSARLYFPFDELVHVREFLGLQSDAVSNAQNGLNMEMDELQIESLEASDERHTSTDEGEQFEQKEVTFTKEEHAAKLKATRMLTFLHAWLATRGRGQDFTHTPMGYICARKALTEDHPFFRQHDEYEALRSRVQHAMAGDALEFADMGIEKDEDGHSDVDEEELDVRHKLTEEELKLAERDEDSEDEEEIGQGEGSEELSEEVEISEPGVE